MHYGVALLYVHPVNFKLGMTTEKVQHLEISYVSSKKAKQNTNMEYTFHHFFIFFFIQEHGITMSLLRLIH